MAYPSSSRKAKKPLSVDVAKERMASLCARCEMSVYDVRAKLKRALMADDDIDAVVYFLRKHKFVDDARYAGAFARDKARFAGWGRLKIRMALMVKHIDSDIIAEALESIEVEDYDESLMKTLRKCAVNLDLSVYENRAKLFRRLASRGFEPSCISRAIARFLNDEC